MPAPLLAAITRIGPLIAGASKTGAAGKGVPSQGAASASQVAGIAQSVMGLADEAKNLIKDVVGKPFDKAADKMKLANSAVNNDANGIVQQIDALPDGVKKFSQALKDLTDSIVERGRELSMFNSNLAQSGAESGVTDMMAKIREANYVGKSYSGVIDERAKFEAQVMDALNPIKEATATITKEVLQSLNSILEIINDNIDIVVMLAEAGVAWFQLFTGNWTEMVKTIQDVPDKIEKAQRSKENQEAWTKTIFNNTVKEDTNLLPRQMEMPGNTQPGFNFGNFG